MTRNEKILLGVAGVAALGALIYFGSKPKAPKLIVVQQPNSLTNTVQQGAQAAAALTPIVTDLFDNIFGSSNSGSGASGQDSSYNSLPAGTTSLFGQDDGSVMSGILEGAGAIQ